MPNYDIFHVPALNWTTVLYFFFSGLAAGSFLMSFWCGYQQEKLKPLAKVSAVVSPISLAIGMVMLLIHLGRPFQFWRIFVTFKPASTISWGSWVLTLFFIVSGLHALLWWMNVKGGTKLLGVLGLPLAIFTGMYTGLLLMQMSGNSLWDSALLPWLFLVGALLSAVAVSILVMALLGKEAVEPFYGLKHYICGLVILELIMVGSEFIALYTGGAESVQIADLFLVGGFSRLFIGLQIIAGSLVPLGLVVFMKARKSAALHVVVSVLLLVGILTVRYLVVMMGQTDLNV